MTARILEGNVFDLLPTIAPGSVDCCVTSPPYWKLRSYLPNDHPLKPLELGSEPTPAAYIANMVRVFQLVREAMADHGTCWVNIGDTYSAYNANRQPSKGSLENRRNGAHSDYAKGLSAPGIPAGNLCLIPQRLAIALQSDGWIVRSVVVWRKPACMPQSVSGWAWRRCRVKVKAQSGRQSVNGEANKGEGWSKASHPEYRESAQWADCPGCPKCEKSGGYVLRRGSWRPTSSWEPVLMLAKSANYFSDGEPVKTAPAAATVSRDQYSRILDDPDEQFAVAHDHETLVTTVNARDVQTWVSEPLHEKHYAAFPTKLVGFCLRAGTSAKGYCPECGGPWVRVVEAKEYGDWRSSERSQDAFHGSMEMKNKLPMEEYTAPKTIGWRPSCSHTAEPRPGLVLDPFAGSGRTGIEAGRMGLDFVGCELNPGYVEMATRLLREEAPLFS